VVASLWHSAQYGEIRSPEGILLWEGGLISSFWDGGRFHVLDAPEGPECGVDNCWVASATRVAIETDDGPQELASGEHLVVSVNGEPYVAVVAKATRTSHGYLDASVCLARTTPLDLPEPATGRRWTSSRSSC
jgi:hypothetical protein